MRMLRVGAAGVGAGVDVNAGTGVDGNVGGIDGDSGGDASCAIAFAAAPRMKRNNANLVILIITQCSGANSRSERDYRATHNRTKTLRPGPPFRVRREVDRIGRGDRGCARWRNRAPFHF